MKLIIFIMDGMPDDNVISGETPVEYAKADCLHNIARQSHPIVVKTIYNGLPVGSIVANLGLLGYDPYKYFPAGRSYFELRARYDGPIGENDLILRCNTISLNGNDEIADFTAGQIPDEVAKQVILEMSKRLPPKYELVHGKNYRNVLVVRDSSLKPRDMISFEPHSRIGSNIWDLRIIQANRKLSLRQNCELRYLNSVLYGSIQSLAEINSRINSKANMLWFWEPSYPAKMFNYREHTGFSKPWIIAGSDFLHGIGIEAGIAFEINDRYTGESDTDFSGKGREAVRKLREGVDFLYLHVNATDEESHQRKFISKARMIEEIDRSITGPLYNYVRSSDEEIVMVIGGDHYTSSASGNHLESDVPLIVYHAQKPGYLLSRYSEREILNHAGPVIESTCLINMLLSGELLEKGPCGGRHERCAA
ncbi:MAG: hypothetical protein JW829_02865 [Pirellulales bacterium]|nr:hypothetical protein [Pirellulales bacterium]